MTLKSQDKDYLKFPFFAIALFNLVIYFPSFYHLPRSDQLCYFYFQASHDNWFDLIFGSYAYNRTVPYTIQDTFVFRPLLFIFMGIEKWLFNYNFMFYQITGLILHLFVLWHLLKLLLLIQRSFFAVLLTAFFSSLLILMEMIIWQHTNGYMLFVICLLMALSQYYPMLTQRQMIKKNLWICFMNLLIGCFILELGWIYSLLLGGLLFLSLLNANRPSKDKLKTSYAPLILCLPAVIYLVFYFIDFYSRGLTFKGGESIFQNFTIGNMISQGLLTILWWFLSGIFPTGLDVYLTQRTAIVPKFFLVKNIFAFVFSPEGLFLLPGTVIFGIYCLLLGKSLTWEFLLKRVTFLILIILFSFCYIFTIILGRSNLYGFLSLLINHSHHTYLFWIFSVLLIYLLIDFKKIGDLKNSFLLRRLSMILLILLTLMNGFWVFKVNFNWAQGLQLRRSIVADINHLIKNHGKETDFSFYLEPSLETNPVMPWVKFANDPPDRKYTYFELLYPQYYKDINPKYHYTTHLKDSRWQQNY